MTKESDSIPNPEISRTENSQPSVPTAQPSKSTWNFLTGLTSRLFTRGDEEAVGPPEITNIDSIDSNDSSELEDICSFF